MLGIPAAVLFGCNVFDAAALKHAEIIAGVRQYLKPTISVVRKQLSVA
jgi:hypothetical protein